LTTFGVPRVAWVCQHQLSFLLLLSAVCVENCPLKIHFEDSYEVAQRLHANIGHMGARFLCVLLQPVACFKRHVRSINLASQPSALEATRNALYKSTVTTTTTTTSLLASGHSVHALSSTITFRDVSECCLATTSMTSS